jgi:hypothetical protein
MTGLAGSDRDRTGWQEESWGQITRKRTLIGVLQNFIGDGGWTSKKT